MAVDRGGPLAVARRVLYLIMFAYGAIFAGLASIHFIWLKPSLIGPFALMIGMTPLVLLFEYSLKLPAYVSPLGAALAGASWLLLRRDPPRPMAVMTVLLGGGVLVVGALLLFVVAEAQLDAGKDGQVPIEYDFWVRPAARVGAVGLLLLASGLLCRATLDRPGGSDEP